MDERARRTAGADWRVVAWRLLCGSGSSGAALLNTTNDERGDDAGDEERPVEVVEDVEMKRKEDEGDDDDAEECRAYRRVLSCFGLLALSAAIPGPRPP